MHTHFCSCKELPEEDFCLTLLASDHFAPSTSEISANPSDLNDEISQINELMEFTTCGELLNTLNCLVKYPACSTDTEKLIPICDTQCLQIDVQIKQCLINLEDKIPGSDFLLVKNLLRSIECDEAETYYNFPFQYIETNSTNCLMLSKLYCVCIYVRYVCTYTYVYTIARYVHADIHLRMIINTACVFFLKHLDLIQTALMIQVSIHTYT